MKLLVVIATALLIAACGSAPAPTTARPVASQGALPISDGDWRVATILPPDEARFRAVSQATGIIVGDQTTWTTTDGVAWLPAEPIEAVNRYGIVTWSGRLVSWAEGGVIQTSPDGLAWTDAAGQPDESNPTAILALPGGLMLFGESTQGNIGGWRSVDGSTWSRSPEVPEGISTAAVRPGGGIVALGNIGANAAAWLSPDGVTWNAAPAPEANGGFVDWTGLAAGPEGVVATGGFEGQSAAAWITRDGSSWTASANPWGADAYLESVTAVGGTFVIAGQRNGRPAIWTSPDGRSWSGLDLPIAGGTSGQAAAIGAGPTGLTVFGYAMQDAANGGDFRSGYLVWTLRRAS